MVATNAALMRTSGRSTVLEALQLELDVVGAGRQPIEAVGAGGVGDLRLRAANQAIAGSVTVTPGRTAPLASEMEPVIPGLDLRTQAGYGECETDPISPRDFRTRNMTPPYSTAGQFRRRDQGTLRP